MTTGHGRPDKLDRKLEGHAGETSSRTNWRDERSSKDKMEGQAQRTNWRDKRSSKDKMERQAQMTNWTGS
jgi:hypothetical protein